MQNTVRITEGDTKYEVADTNSGTIAAAASQTFLSGALDKAANSQHGSFNYLELVNDSSEEILVDLDGLSIRRRKLFQKSVLVIKPSENIFFNNVKITNNDSSNTIAANEIQIIGRIVR